MFQPYIKHKILFITAFLFTSTFAYVSINMIGSPQVSSQETNITVTPAIIELVVEPGEKNQSVISIGNSSAAPAPLSFEVTSLISQTTQDSVPDNLDAKSWIKMPSESELFKAGEKREFVLEVDVPLDASPGGHYASVIIRGLSIEESDQSRTLVLPEVSVGVLLVVRGEISEVCEFGDSDIAPTYITQGKGFTTSFYIRNEGNIHNIVQPELILMSDDQEISREVFASEIILPGEEKLFSKKIDAPKVPGRYEVIASLVYGSEAKRIKMKAHSVVGPPPLMLAGLWVSTWISLYFIHNRKRMRLAWRVLIHPTSLRLK